MGFCDDALAAVVWSGLPSKLLKLHTISGGNYACIYVIVNCLNNTPLAVRLFNVCLFGEGGFGFRNGIEIGKHNSTIEFVEWSLFIHGFGEGEGRGCE